MSKSLTPDLPLSRSGREAMDVAIEAARGAGEILRNRFGEANNIQSKGKRNITTEGDLQAERYILDILKSQYPDHSILSEEAGEIAVGGEYRWIIDPLDGTTNYAFGIPVYSVSIGLAVEDDIVLGVIYDPLRDELFRAQKGGGAFLNDTPISVAAKEIPHTTVIGLDLGYDDAKTRQMLALLLGLWSSETVLRLIGSAALGMAYVSCGRMNLYIHPSIHPWDMAAGILLVSEAGGATSDWHGQPATVWNSRIVSCDNLSACDGVKMALSECPD